MGPSLFSILLILVLSPTFGKYVYINQSMTWWDAQAYCRKYQTDLATISNQGESDFAKQILGSNPVWIGLKRNFTDNEKWVWSAGGDVTTFFWDSDQPNSTNEQCGAIVLGKWHDEDENSKYTFLCSSVNLVREEKTWEEAVDYCKKKGGNLASVSSVTDLMLIGKELYKEPTTDNVWISLRYLAGGWLWIDGLMINFESWVQGLSGCPITDLSCGSLLVQNTMCLITEGDTNAPQTNDSTTTTATTTTTTTKKGLSAILSVKSLISTATTQDLIQVCVNQWIGKRCNETFHFICN